MKNIQLPKTFQMEQLLLRSDRRWELQTYGNGASYYQLLDIIYASLVKKQS